MTEADGGGAGPLRVYVLRSEVSRLVKVGISINAERRLRDLRRSSGVPIVLEQLIDPGKWPARKVERAAHGILAKHRKCGEWFAVSVERALAAIHKAMRRLEAEELKRARSSGCANALEKRSRGRPVGSASKSKIPQSPIPEGQVFRYRDKSRIVRGRGRPPGKPKLHVASARLEQIRVLAQEGYSRAAAAQKMGVSAGTLARLLRSEPLAKKAWDRGAKCWDVQQAKRQRQALCRLLRKDMAENSETFGLRRGRPLGSKNRVYPRAPKKFVTREVPNLESR